MIIDKQCPNCKAHDISVLVGSDNYIYHAICLTCTYELSLEERLDLGLEEK